ncbi:MAG TPA: hypothetical protein VJN02_03110 [Gammaproteobacteria bacterium]|nr:hypothetical protein [Gammaproteobacteria bacterium]
MNTTLQYSEVAYSDALEESLIGVDQEATKILRTKYNVLNNAIIGAFLKSDTNSVNARILRQALIDCLKSGKLNFVTDIQRIKFMNTLFCDTYVLYAGEIEIISKKLNDILFYADFKRAQTLLGIAEFELRDTISRLRQQMRRNGVIF